MARKYGPSRTRWLLIGFVIGLLVGIVLGSPEAGVASIMNPGEILTALQSITF